MSCTGVDILAPKIISRLSGKNQNPIYRSRPKPAKFLVLSYLFNNWLATAAYRFAALFKGWLTSARYFPVSAINEGEIIYAAHGCFICLPQEYFKRGGALKCSSFLYLEEICLAEESIELGLAIRYTNKIKVHHEEHASTSFIPPNHIRKHLVKAHRIAYQVLSR